jgi:hypothetical protein
LRLLLAFSAPNNKVGLSRLSNHLNDRLGIRGVLHYTILPTAGIDLSAAIHRVGAFGGSQFERAY